MKVICEKRKEIEIVRSCRKEFCCKKLEKAFMNSDTERGATNYYTNFSIQKGKVQLNVRNAEYCSESEFISYCPFCRAKLVVENIEIDNTGLDPIQGMPDPDLEMHLINKKKHWWN